jgi:predicted transcriptional regulator
MQAAGHNWIMAESFDELVQRTTTKKTRDLAARRAEELLVELNFRQKADEGLQQLDAGERIEHEDAPRKLGKWLH